MKFKNKTLQTIFDVSKSVFLSGPIGKILSWSFSLAIFGLLLHLIIIKSIRVDDYKHDNHILKMFTIPDSVQVPDSLFLQSKRIKKPMLIEHQRGIARNALLIYLFDTQQIDSFLIDTTKLFRIEDSLDIHSANPTKLNL